MEPDCVVMGFLHVLREGESPQTLRVGVPHAGGAFGGSMEYTSMYAAGAAGPMRSFCAGPADYSGHQVRRESPEL